MLQNKVIIVPPAVFATNDKKGDIQNILNYTVKPEKGEILGDALKVVLPPTHACYAILNSNLTEQQQVLQEDRKLFDPSRLDIWTSVSIKVRMHF